MRGKIIILFFAIAFLFAGCKDITDTFKPAGFGKTDEENAMVKAVTEKYGDLAQPGDPRFLEAMMTTGVNNSIPVDKVSKYSKDTEKLYVWFIYDNFNEDNLDIEWIYLNDNYSIHTFKSKTGQDFGRGTFILEKPDDGWPIGNYKVVIKGRGVQTSVEFEIVSGNTVSVPIMTADGKIKLSQNPGWYLTGWEYFIAQSDITLVGWQDKGKNLYDYLEGKGEKNNFSISAGRKDGNGKMIATGSCTVTWTDPPEFIAPGEKVSINVNRQVHSSWGISQMSVTIDSPDILPGGATSSAINFATPDGTTHIGDYSGSFQSLKAMPADSKHYAKRGIIVSLGNIYGYRYNYEWRD